MQEDKHTVKQSKRNEKINLLKHLLPIFMHNHFKTVIADYDYEYAKY